MIEAETALPHLQHPGRAAILMSPSLSLHGHMFARVEQALAKLAGHSNTGSGAYPRQPPDCGLV